MIDSGASIIAMMCARIPPSQMPNVPKVVSNIDVDRSIGTKRAEKKEKKNAGEISYKLPSHHCSASSHSSS